jgi:hypothetical protein
VVPVGDGRTAEAWRLGSKAARRTRRSGQYSDSGSSPAAAAAEALALAERAAAAEAEAVAELGGWWRKNRRKSEVGGACL